MALETASYIGQLVTSNPSATDDVSKGDDHLRLLKNVLQTTFPSLTFPIAFNATTKVVLEATTLALMRTALGALGAADSNILTGTLRLEHDDDGAGASERLDLVRLSDDPAVDDLLHLVRLIGKNSTAAEVVYAALGAQIKNKTAAAEAGELYWQTAYAGAIAARLRLGQGLYSPNAVDGDKGADTANFKHIYKDGVEVGAMTYISTGTSYSAVVGDSGSTIEFTSTATLDLPTAVGNRGAKFNVVSASSAVTVTIDPAGAETLDGLASRKVTKCRVAIISDGANWKTCEGEYFYDSGDQAVTAGGNLTLTHNLGVVPDQVSARLKCTVADGGYAIGDIIELATVSNSASQGAQVRVTASSVVVNQSASIYALGKATHAWFELTYTSWRWNITARAR